MENALHSTRNIKTDNSQVFREICTRFLRTTSLHALKFIADNEITNGEKWFFSLAFLLAVISSACYIMAIYSNWMESPVIITTSSIPSSVSTIPFPAITICSLNQAKKSVVMKFKKNSLDYWRLKSLCKSNLSNIPSRILEMPGKGCEYRDFIRNVSQSCEEMLIACQFGAEKIGCQLIFQPVLLDEGYCCAFNTVASGFMFVRGGAEAKVANWTGKEEAVDWTPERGYGSNLHKNILPRTASGTGVHMGLSIILNASLDDYYCSSANSAGFKMMMHSPIETPKVMDYGYLLATGVESRVSINPEVHMASPAIESMNVQYRNCLFNSESTLKLYRTYTKSNCELECELQKTIAACHCVPYYLQRATINMTICGLKELNCMRQVQVASNSLLSTEVKCSRCRPGCTSVDYYPTISTSALKADSLLLTRLLNIKQRKEFDNLALVHFYYENNSFRSKNSDELLNFTDFLANSGGILGVFMGFSFLAAIELLYFSCLLPCRSIKWLFLNGFESKTTTDAMKRKSKQYASYSSGANKNVKFMVSRERFNPRFTYYY